MDYRLTAEQEALKKEIESYYGETIKDKPPGYRGTLGLDIEATHGSEIAAAYDAWSIKSWQKETKDGYGE